MRILLRVGKPILVALSFLSVGSCEGIVFGSPDDPVAGVGITLGFAGSTSDAFLSVGDKDTVRAQAYTGRWPSYTKYDSNDDPRRFTYSSSDRTVASVDLDGVVETHSAGTTRLFASVDGVTSAPLLLSVSPPAKSLVMEPDSVAVSVGEKFTISVKAIDTSGAPVSGVVFNVGVDTTYWAVTTIPDEGSWKLRTPAVLHLTGRLAGRVHFLAYALNERPEAQFSASVPVIVRAP